MAKSPVETDSKKTVKEPLKHDESLKQTKDDVFMKAPAPKVEEPAPKAKEPEVVPEVPKPKRYICRVKCWVPKYGIFEQGAIAEFGPGDTVPSHFEEIK